MNIAVALAIGLLSGAHTSTWGMYKDSPHEGFTWRKYFRSIVLSGALAVVWELALGFDLARAWMRFVLFGLTYVTERGLVELYKTYLARRTSRSTSSDAIPRDGTRGREPPRALAVAAGWVVVVLGVVFGLRAFQAASPRCRAGWSSSSSAASAAGSPRSAAPSRTRRSRASRPSSSSAARRRRSSGRRSSRCSAATSSTSPSAVSATPVATIETYKTFFFPHRPRGKFAGKPILFPGLLTWRYRFARSTPRSGWRAREPGGRVLGAAGGPARRLDAGQPGCRRADPVKVALVFVVPRFS
jgi:hypothetical protein